MTTTKRIIMSDMDYDIGSEYEILDYSCGDFGQRKQLEEGSKLNKIHYENGNKTSTKFERDFKGEGSDEFIRNDNLNYGKHAEENSSDEKKRSFSKNKQVSEEKERKEEDLFESNMNSSSKNKTVFVEKESKEEDLFERNKDCQLKNKFGIELSDSEGKDCIDNRKQQSPINEIIVEVNNEKDDLQELKQRSLNYKFGIEVSNKKDDLQNSKQCSPINEFSVIIKNKEDDSQNLEQCSPQSNSSREKKKEKSKDIEMSEINLSRYVDDKNYVGMKAPWLRKSENADSYETQSSGENDPSSSHSGKITKGPWSKDEDKKLLSIIKENTPKNWSKIAELMGSRIGKQCRERWHNHLHPGIRKSPFTPEEDTLIQSLHETMGNRWSEIAKFLPGRTDNAIKNHWNSSLVKKVKRSMSMNDVNQNNFEINEIICLEKSGNCCCYWCIRKNSENKFKPITRNNYTKNHSNRIQLGYNTRQNLLRFRPYHITKAFIKQENISNKNNRSKSLNITEIMKIRREFEMSSEDEKLASMALLRLFSSM